MDSIIFYFDSLLFEKVFEIEFVLYTGHQICLYQPPLFLTKSRILLHMFAHVLIVL